MNRSMTGSRNYHDGLAAERSVERHYERLGCEVVERRWRGTAGEIDLIARKDGKVILVEVKKAKDFFRAAESLGARQLARIVNTGTEYLGCASPGSFDHVQIDLALVNVSGEIQVLENVTM